jgi:hypothetical protein
MDKVLMALAIGAIFWCIGDAIVRIIRASRTGGGKQTLKRIDELEADLAEVEQDLEDAMKRIEVLEQIVTDDKQDLKRQIDDLG